MTIIIKKTVLTVKIMSFMVSRAVVPILYIEIVQQRTERMFEKKFFPSATSHKRGFDEYIKFFFEKPFNGTAINHSFFLTLREEFLTNFFFCSKQTLFF